MRGRVAIAALLPFALEAYIVVAEAATPAIVQGLLVIASLVLAARGAGLKRFKAETAPAEGVVRVEAEFEDPVDTTDR